MWFKPQAGAWTKLVSCCCTVSLGCFLPLHREWWYLSGYQYAHVPSGTKPWVLTLAQQSQGVRTAWEVLVLTVSPPKKVRLSSGRGNPQKRSHGITMSPRLPQFYRSLPQKTHLAIFPLRQKSRVFRPQNGQVPEVAGSMPSLDTTVGKAFTGPTGRMAILDRRATPINLRYSGIPGQDVNLL